MTTYKFWNDKTITEGNSTKAFAAIDRDSYQMRTGQRGKTTVSVFRTGEKIEMSAPLYVPSVQGSVSDWTVNPAFCAELAEKIGE